MIEIKVPELAESIKEGTIAAWLKQVGDYVNQGEYIAELETDKMNVEITTEHAGFLTEIKREQGDSVEIGEVIAVIDEYAEKGKTVESNQSSKVEKEKKNEELKPEEHPFNQQPKETGAKPIASPAARKYAREHGIDLNQVRTPDSLGRLRKHDVETFEHKPSLEKAPQKPVTQQQAHKQVERVKMSPRRQTIAKRLVESQKTAATLTTFNEVDLTAVMDVRQRRKEAFVEKNNVKLGFMSFFTKAVVSALKEFPLLNAEIDGDKLIIKKHYDIGCAVSTDKGLVVPVLRDVDRLSFAGIERGISQLGKKARDNKISLADFQGGTFTNYKWRRIRLTPILNAPQVGILGMHTIQWRPVAIDKEKIENRPMMYIALSYDHRIVDGKEAVSFLVKVKQLLEDPEALLLEG
ncbi:2-oxoglutarate dehydrogenase complex dihydrolipoyllysine-residue succinyltransferase [Halalkalibacter urbisdiaboli]|uniref:2-oxoglutarate dehydrogenase complex dihydrolipoyllysine-residue succinyltransferase n=1 Tax=Halalkalibacter urbisdiaboli TaxID=1960589 RepID=UPI000B43711B|nr:2-oxoglutarate dehydrogenase complex dihydrolipoyllysine-residue succinyltransferase [Halalkalibacter urbisdiaboli]